MYRAEQILLGAETLPWAKSFESISFSELDQLPAEFSYGAAIRSAVAELHPESLSYLDENASATLLLPRENTKQPPIPMGILFITDEDMQAAHVYCEDVQLDSFFGDTKQRQSFYIVRNDDPDQVHTLHIEVATASLNRIANNEITNATTIGLLGNYIHVRKGYSSGPGGRTSLYGLDHKLSDQLYGLDPSIVANPLFCTFSESLLESLSQREIIGHEAASPTQWESGQFFISGVAS